MSAPAIHHSYPAHTDVRGQTPTTIAAGCLHSNIQRNLTWNRFTHKHSLLLMLHEHVLEQYETSRTFAYFILLSPPFFYDWLFYYMTSRTVISVCAGESDWCVDPKWSKVLLMSTPFIPLIKHHLSLPKKTPQKTKKQNQKNRKTADKFRWTWKYMWLLIVLIKNTHLWLCALLWCDALNCVVWQNSHHVFVLLTAVLLHSK